MGLPSPRDIERSQRISPFVKYLVVAVFGFFAFMLLRCMMGGAWAGAAGAGIVLLLIAPLVFAVCMPGRYLLHPHGGSYFSVRTFRQFLKDYPGWDGKLIVGVFVSMLLLNLVGSIHYFLAR
ncbi:MAG TPA: hypothetical protein VNZ68_12230 [Rhodocyclaceae bacterium]|nr:hypothetical protein [Rhodocyclaceae bacterium]